MTSASGQPRTPTCWGCRVRHLKSSWHSWAAGPSAPRPADELDVQARASARSPEHDGSRPGVPQRALTAAGRGGAPPQILSQQRSGDGHPQMAAAGGCSPKRSRWCSFPSPIAARCAFPRRSACAPRLLVLRHGPAGLQSQPEHRRDGGAGVAGGARASSARNRSARTPPRPARG